MYKIDSFQLTPRASPDPASTKVPHLQDHIPNSKRTILLLPIMHLPFLTFMTFPLSVVVRSLPLRRLRQPIILVPTKLCLKLARTPLVVRGVPAFPPTAYVWYLLLFVARKETSLRSEQSVVISPLRLSDLIFKLLRHLPPLLLLRLVSLRLTRV